MADSKQKPDVRIWCDGVYDMVHFGHANHFRQAKSMGDYLIVGVHNDEDVLQHKGPTVFTEEERYKMVRGIKWVDEVVEAAPYIPTVEALNSHGCDFIVHGDDIPLSADGEDTYLEVKAAGKFKECRRTAGVSTTDLVSRMLMTEKHSSGGDNIYSGREDTNEQLYEVPIQSPWTLGCQFMPTTNGISQFSDGRIPKPGNKIVYTSGAFDLFHLGHLSFLEEAAKLGDFVIVGIHTDHVVKYCKGHNYPIMTLHERVMSVLACRYVDEVVIGAPYTISEEMMNHFKIDVVVHGFTPITDDPIRTGDANLVPKTHGKFKQVHSNCNMTTETICHRIISRKLEFQDRNEKKAKKEIAVYNTLIKKREFVNNKC